MHISHEKCWMYVSFVEEMNLVLQKKIERDRERLKVIERERERQRRDNGQCTRALRHNTTMHASAH